MHSTGGASSWSWCAILLYGYRTRGRHLFQTLWIIVRTPTRCESKHVHVRVASVYHVQQSKRSGSPHLWPVNRFEKSKVGNRQFYKRIHARNVFKFDPSGKYMPSMWKAFNFFLGHFSPRYFCLSLPPPESDVMPSLGRYLLIL